MYKDRREYGKTTLLESDLATDPVEQFHQWYKEAKDAGIADANAMSLATIGHGQRPSQRIVLLKEVKDNQFVFFTNYGSRKGREIEENPQCSLLFFWPQLERQIRIEGRLSKVSIEDTKEYFYSRPKEAQLGALASRQSEVLPDRETLDNRFEHLKKEFEKAEIPLPDYWGGYAVTPEYFEFWQGRISRLHDRLVYRKNQDNQTWEIIRLSP